MMSKITLTIGRLAKSAEVNIETVRYYEREGLIVKPIKPSSGFRIYSNETINRIRFIKRAQKLGFSLRDIRHLMALGKGHCDDVRQQAEIKLSEIELQIKDLQSIRRTLKKLVRECYNDANHQSCPIVESLTKKSKSNI